MRQVALQVTPHARAQRRIARLAVALPQPGEDADDLRVPLRAQHVIRVHERIPLAGRGAIPRQHPILQRGIDVAPRILQQADQVIGRVPRQRVLEIQQPHAPLRPDQHQVLGVIVTQHRDRDQRFRPVQHRIPCRAIARDIGRRAHRRAIPFGQQPRLALQFGAVIGAQLARRMRAQRHQQVDRRLIQRHGGHGVGIRRLAQPVVAEILQQHQPAVQVQRQDRRGRERSLRQPARHRDERARVFVRRGRIHQDRAPRAVMDAEVSPERGIAGQRVDPRAGPAVKGQKVRRAIGRGHRDGHRASHAAGAVQVKRRAPSGVA